MTSVQSGSAVTVTPTQPPSTTATLRPGAKRAPATGAAQQQRKQWGAKWGPIVSHIAANVRERNT